MLKFHGVPVLPDPEFEAGLAYLKAVDAYALRVKAAPTERGFEAEHFTDLSPALAIAALTLGVK
jgi:hypothetical protein